MKIINTVLYMLAFSTIIAYSTSSYAYTVNCTGVAPGTPVVQDAIDLIGNSETIFIEGVCADQGLINILTSGVTLQGVGGLGALANNVIQGQLRVVGAQFVNIGFLTLESDSPFAVSLAEVSNARFTFCDLRSTVATGNATVISALSSRVVIIGGSISINAMGGDGTGLNGASNSTLVTTLNATISANATGTATGIAATSGTVAYIDNGDTISASGATSYAVNIRQGGILQSLDNVPNSGEFTTLNGDIRVNKGIVRLNNVVQATGQTIMIDSAFEVLNSEVYSTTLPIALRNSSINISSSTIDADIEAFFDTNIAIEENSTVNGIASLSFGSKAAILNASSIDTVMEDDTDCERSVFVDVTSSINNLLSNPSCQKSKDNKKDK